ncbi:conserved hypothetical plastid protein (plastid) [Chondrus crispus]|uniref:Conserved hypothetical plastid protein n=1 Tax=Chondrus crispus TaxID=2769 RepID=M5DD28_CHOCR|nr:conserved hypothetical plastid protein [Chondrus crispus]CCP38185.1 conserved hypothetical plastid protein [Chondrus crispus]|eukprot:YP_007627438.1 conserved hypothetical plastid protein (plastid) [Chondrus crispus]
MLINLFQIAFLHTYIISPTTWIHRIPYHKRISFIFIFLHLLPYLNYEHLLIITIFYVIMANCIKIATQYTENKCYIFFISLIACLGTNITKVKNQFFYKDLISLLINIDMPHFIIQNLNKHLYLRIIIKSSYILILPKFIVRAILIIILYSILIKLLLLTTLYEEIVLYYLIQYMNYQNNISKEINLILVLGYQFIITFINKIHIAITAIRLRNINNMFYLKQYFLYYYAIKNILIFIEEDIYRVTSILYIREIQCTNITIVDVNY